MYKMYSYGMNSVTMSEFRNQQSSLIAAVQREPGRPARGSCFSRLL